MEWNDELPGPSEVREPAVAYGKSKFTIEEYLEMERASQWKHEYYQGEIFAMSGASNRHEIIFANLFGDLAHRSKGHNCRPLGSNMRLHIPENTLFTYPDISIYCGEIKTLDKEEDSAIGPTALIEILSPSTRKYDMGKKFELYQSIPTLKEYILVDTQAVQITVFRRNAQKTWESQIYTGPSALLQVQTLGLSVPLSEIYKDTALES